MDETARKLEASAGSGKTYRLTREYLVRLFGTLPRTPAADGAARRGLAGILAVTFTNQAANEMKSRIVDALREFSTSGPSGRFADLGGELRRATGVAGADWPADSRRALAVILDHYDDFHVRTIDSLMNAMIQALAPELGLPPGFTVSIRGEGALRQTAREFLDRLAETDWPAMLDFLQEMTRLEGATSWDQQELAAGQLLNLFHRVMREEVSLAGPPPDEAGRRFAEARQELATALIGVHRWLEAGGEGLHGSICNASLKGGLAAVAAGEWPAGEEGFFTRPFFLRGDPALLFRKGALAGEIAAFAPVHARVRFALSRYARVRAAQRLVHAHGLLAPFLGFWRERRPAILVEEFSRLLAGQVHDWGCEAFPYLYLKLSDRFVHFLFDEFQDTSELQFAALAPLIDEVLSGRESASLFLVGDRKQAIYRWRGGQASLMEEERLRELIPALDHRTPAGFSETLALNWRSDAAVVEFNNGFWGPEVWPALAGSSELAERLAAHFASAVQTLPAERKYGAGFVSVGVLAPSGGAEEGEESPVDGDPPYLAWLLSRVREFMRAGYAEEDLAVLVRRNEEVGQVVAAFTAAGLRTVAERSLSLGACPEVRELLSAMRFLDFPPDDLSFFQFVAGRVFQTRARQVAPGERPAASGWAVRRHRGQPLYTVFRELFPQCWQRLIAPFFTSAGILPAYDLIADLLSEFAVYENFPDSTPMLFGFADWLHRLEGEGVSSVSAVLARWLEGDGERESAGSEGHRGVHVLTMHQAKGLEFPVVLLPLTDHRPPNRLPILVCQGELTAARKDWARLDPGLAAARDRETLEEWIDALNLLYVAFTRPIQALEVGAFPRSQAGGGGGEDDPLPSFPGFASLVSRHPLLDGQGSRTRSWGEWPRPAKGPTGDDAPRRPVTGPRMATRDWQREMLVFSRRQATPGKPAPARSRGEAIHGALSLLPGGMTAPELPAAWVRVATGQGLAPAEVERVAALLGRPEVAALFAGGEAFCEREVLAGSVEDPELLRLDRLVAHPGEFWVVEFKTGPEPAPAHREQVRHYAATLAPLFPGRTPRGFLLYLDRGEVEEVPC